MKLATFPKVFTIVTYIQVKVLVGCFNKRRRQCRVFLWKFCEISFRMIDLRETFYEVIQF